VQWNGVEGGRAGRGCIGCNACYEEDTVLPERHPDDNVVVGEYVPEPHVVGFLGIDDEEDVSLGVCGDLLDAQISGSGGVVPLDTKGSKICKSCVENEASQVVV
jgi:hypothetical protein